MLKGIAKNYPHKDEKFSQTVQILLALTFQ